MRARSAAIPDMTSRSSGNFGGFGRHLEILALLASLQQL
jgi:hypothetical protein